MGSVSGTDGGGGGSAVAQGDRWLRWAGHWCARAARAEVTGATWARDCYGYRSSGRGMATGGSRLGWAKPGLTDTVAQVGMEKER